ncbi:DNA-directed RNA polymerase subunit omega [Nesterenkonia massiliensis]|uniref:DNA-directed RNA polymerase subunit omega n=1 Tax=Nesterenkonia massiliensis TaxID=1232429 RepID=A0ABT2HNA4_9MICC|nr:DNA-directed RNA polymerase subunit omega [Nesterenkonia massiliensis]MCT1606173.1 DNA-directed RNA polymerase subunit omega [Nesterenkonia massiliensis]
MTEQLEGIIDPPIDALVAKADSKYALVLFAAKRARQINNYYAQLHEGLFEHIGPLVETKLNEKPLSIALREIHEGLLVQKPKAQASAEAEAA